MPVPISNVTRRQVYAPSGAGGAGPYAFTFEILANTDIAVFKDDVLLTLTTHYTVVINANGTGSVTITATGLALAPASPTQYAIVGNRTIARATDFTTGGDFFANTLNDELDQQTIFAQQNAEGLQRALSAPQTDPTTINMVLPLASLRANKTLGFDANGNPALGETLGTNRGNWAASTVYFVRDIVKDTTTNNIFQVITAHTSSGALPITTNADAAKFTLLVDAASATTSATNAAASASAASTSASNASTSASNASTSASNASSSASAASTSASNANTAKVAAEAARDSALAAYDNFDDRYLGPYASNPTLDNDGNALLAGALYFNTVVPEMRLYTGSAWVAAYVSGAAYLLTSNNLSELSATASTARSNLGLVIGTNVQAWDADLDTFAGKTAPSGTIVGTTDTQTLTNKTLTTPVISSISNTGTVTLPTSTDTLVGRATTDTLTNKTLTNPTLTTPALGTPSSGTLSACTIDGTDAVGFRNIPVNSQSTAYTAVLADSGKVIFHPSTDANARTFTIPANSSVAYAIGTAITFINMTSQVVTIAITTDTMYLSSAGTTGSRSLAQYGSATAIKMTSTTWLISGSGLT